VTRPNLALVTCHDLGRHLGCYGVPSLSTPNLDSLAARGTRLTAAFCVAPQCSPSRAALATGRYPHSNGVMGLAHGSFGWDLAAGERHAAELLGGAGYDTHLFGLQHVTPNVQRLGFHRVHGQGTGPEVAREVASFLRTEADRRPFYAEVNLFEPHRPFDFGGAEPDASTEPYVPAYLPAGEASRRELSALQGAIRRADESCGRILSALDDAQLASDTMVVFTADHGIAMPRAKCTLYDPGIEVALMARWPNGFRGGATVTELISNVDVLPTLLDAASERPSSRLQGRSFLPLLRDDVHEPRTAVYAEKTWHSYYDPMRAVRTKRHKLIRNFEAGFAIEVPADVQRGDVFRAHPELYSTDRSAQIELYDLEEDPLEQRNAAGAPHLAQVQADLDDRLWSWMRATEDPLLLGPVASPRFTRAPAQRRRK
jgi:N-sulfoglucosamine sulfohydrolase